MFEKVWLMALSKRPKSLTPLEPPKSFIEASCNRKTSPIKIIEQVFAMWYCIALLFYRNVEKDSKVKLNQ